MKLRSLIITLTILLFAFSLTTAQVIITKSDSIPLENDNIVKFVLPEIRGNIQWQKSIDSVNWINLETETNDTLTFSIDNEAVYRAVVSEGTCMPVYSDTAKLEFTSPKISTSVPQNITYNGVLLGGKLESNGGTSILEMGICYSKSENPTIEDKKIIVGNNISLFDTTLTDLVQETKYFARTYAINNKGVGYGEQVDFTTEKYAFILSKEVQTNSGDTLTAPDGTTLIIPENSFLTDGTVTFKINDYESDIDTSQNLIQTGDIYTVKFPGDTILNNLILKFKLPASVDVLESYTLFITNGECYYPIEYMVVDDTVMAIIDINDWICFQSEIKSVQLFAEIYLIGYLVPEQNPDNYMLGLKEINTNGDLDFLNPDTYLTPNKEINSKIWLFVHGWTGAPTTWEKMIPILKEKMKDDITIWTFGYNSGLSIDKNGEKLLDAIKKNSENCQIDVIAHSMGGLVSRSMLENHNGSNLVNKLVTIGTPHLGSPPAEIRNVIGYFKTIAEPWSIDYYNYNTQGIRDLSNSSIFISSLKNNVPSNRYYLISAENDGKFFVSRLIRGPDDGIVSVESAQGIEPNILAPTVPMGSGLVHTEMTRNNTIIQQVSDFLAGADILYINKDDKVFIRAYNIDDIAECFINDKKVFQVNWGDGVIGHAAGKMDWMDVTVHMNNPQNQISFKGTNNSGCCYFSYGFQIRIDDAIVWEDEKSITSSAAGVFYDKNVFVIVEEYKNSPVLTNPAVHSVFNKNNTESVSIQWNSVTGADEYWLNVFPKGQAASPVFDSSVGSATNKNLTISTLENGIYVFQVKARASGGEWSEFSASREFVVDIPPAAPTLSSPAHEASVTRNTLQNFSWTAPSEGIDRYNVRIVSGTNLDASPVYEAEIPGLKDTISCIWEPGTYIWSVRVMKETPAGYSATTYESTIGWGAYAPERTFEITEAVTLPTVSTTTVTEITQTTATGGGNVTSDGGAPVTARGICWNTSQNPSINNEDKTIDGSGKGSFISHLTGLTAGTTYYVRAYATNSEGTAYGEQETFKAKADEATSGTFTDSRDGNTYKWVKIGEQVWMAENLAYLPKVDIPDGESRYDDTIPVYYVYNYNGTDVGQAKANQNYSDYGVLYNYVAALEVCPNGWHLPSAGEWEQLAQYISDTKGPYETDGAYFFNRSKHLKATDGWDNNGNGLDDFGFSAMPGGQYGSGYVQDSLQFGGIGNSGYWWSDTKSWFMYHFTETLYGAALEKSAARSIRCIKD